MRRNASQAMLVLGDSSVDIGFSPDSTFLRGRISSKNSIVRSAVFGKANGVLLRDALIETAKLAQ